MISLKDQACIVGVGETEYVRGAGSGATGLALQLRAGLRAIEDAGLSPRQIDGIMPGIFHDSMAEDFMMNYGIKDLRFSAWCYSGGASPGASLLTAAMAVATGQANYVLCASGWNGYSGPRARSSSLVNNADFIIARHIDNHYRPYGGGAPAHHYAWLTRRYMHEYNLKAEQLGAVAVAERRHAQLNPKAVMYGRPMTMEDYLNAPMIANPLRLYDCCLETDGASAVVVTTAERARDMRKKPVYIMGFAQGRPYPPDEILNRKDFFNVGVSWSAPRAMAMAGVEHKDIDFAMLYDNFTYCVLRQIEEIGFCKRGEAGAFAEGGRIELGGDLPINTHGGTLSEAHTAGMNHIVEATRQLRGEADARQVAGARIGLVSNWGGGWGASSINILHN